MENSKGTKEIPMKNVFVCALVALMAACASSPPAPHEYKQPQPYQDKDEHAPPAYEAPTPNQGVPSYTPPPVVYQAPQSSNPVAPVHDRFEILCGDEELRSAFERNEIVCTVAYLMKVRGLATFDAEKDLPPGCRLEGDVIKGPNTETIKALGPKMASNSKYTNRKTLPQLVELVRRPNSVVAKADCIDPANPSRGVKSYQVEFFLYCDTFRIPGGKSIDDPDEVGPALLAAGINFR
jgi:hypothetical protein